MESEAKDDPVRSRDQPGGSVGSIESIESMSKMKVKDSNAKKVMKGKAKPLYFWTSADVNKWLRKHGGHCYDLYGAVFSDNDVTGRTLIRMNDIKLEKIGITSNDDRRELMQHILRLRLKHEFVDLKNLDQKGSGFELKLPDVTRTPQEKSSKLTVDRLK